MANHLFFEIVFVSFTLALTAGPVYGKKQTEQTCRALDTLVENGYKERIGQCKINSDCTSIACRAELVQPAPNTAVSIISFDPCSNPVSVHVHVNTSLLQDLPILNERVTSSKSVKAKPEPLGTFSITLKQHDGGGVTFGVVHQSQFDPEPVKLFPMTYIPFKCNEAIEDRNSPMDYSNGNHRGDYNDYYDNQQEERNSNHYQGNERETNMNTDQELVDRSRNNDNTQDKGRRSDTADSPRDQLEADNDDEATADFNSTANSENATALTTEANIPVSSIIQVLMIMVLLGVVALHIILAVVNFVACLKF